MGRSKCQSKTVKHNGVIRPVMQCFDQNFIVRPNKLFDQQSRFGWFEMDWRSYDMTVMAENVCSVFYDKIYPGFSWWRQQMETFSALLDICAGNSPVPGEFSAQRPVTRSFDVYFDLRLNKRLSKQSWGWWFETLSRPLWSYNNGKIKRFWKFLRLWNHKAYYISEKPMGAMTSQLQTECRWPNRDCIAGRICSRTSVLMSGQFNASISTNGALYLHFLDYYAAGDS